METFFRNMKIKSQMLWALGIMAILCTAMGVLGLVSMMKYNELVSHMEQASTRSLIAANINESILAVVMDSRGIYMGQGQEDVEKYGVPLLANLKKIDEKMKDWRKLLPPHQEQEFNTSVEKVNEFIKYRSELVRLAREVSISDARAWGDNDANRSNRKKLNELITSLSQQNAVEVHDAVTAVKDFYQQQSILLLALLAGVMPVMILGAYLLSSAFIVKPIRHMTSGMRNLAGGNLQITVFGLGQTNEIGEMANAVEIFRAGLIEAKNLNEAERQSKIAQEVRVHKLDDLIREFDLYIQEALDTISASSTELEATAQALSAMAEESSRTATSVAAASEEATTNVQAVADASERMNASIVHVIQDIEESNIATSQAAHEAQETSKVVEGLLDATRKIDDVVMIIQAIASQTNLLALNATIEAARAGEMGKGFAVVANEVKNLATQTATSTEEIAQQVGSVQTVSTQVVGAINKICATIQKINDMSSNVTNTMANQGQMTREILSNIVEAATGTREVSENIQNVSQGATETGDASQQLLVAASDIARQSSTLRDKVSYFLKEVKAL